MTGRRIESRQNSRVRFYRGLGRRGAREASGFMAAEGVRLVVEALTSAVEVPEVFLSDALKEGEAGEIRWALEGRQPGATTVWRLPEAVFSAMAHTRSPQGAAALVRIPAWVDPLAGPEAAGAVAVLHRPQDPGNLGTVIRSAEAAGFGALALVEPACDPFNPKAVRASMGSVFRVPVVRVRSFGELAVRLAGEGYRVLAADPRAPVGLHEVDVAPPVAVLFGGEAAGLPPLEGIRVTHFSLPMRGRVESLNLAQAATVVMYEVMRRGLVPGGERSTPWEGRGR